MKLVIRFASALMLAVGLSGCEQLAPAKGVRLALAQSISNTAPAGSAVTGISVYVYDQYGGVLAGQPLTITTTTGSIVNAATQTGNGPTPIGTWLLAQKAGINILKVTSGTLPELTVSIAGTAGAPAKITATLPGTATVARTIDVVFTVFDAFDNTVAATIVSASSDAGQIATPAAVTDGAGTTTMRWVLGTTRGTQTITAAAGATTKAFTILTVADLPAQMGVVAGNGQVGLAATALPVRPSVLVTDNYGNPTPGRTVTFALTLGGGSLAGSLTATTDNNGIATGPTWTLGKVIAPQRLTATSSGLVALVNATVNPGLPIALRYFGAGTEAYQTTFAAAATRLRAMIVSGGAAESVTDLVISGACGVAGADNITETINGVVIYAGIVPIDGPGGAVTRTTMCATRSAASKFQPMVSSIIIDVDDILLLGPPLGDVIVHEMLHALGFGGLWAPNTLLDLSSGGDPRYIGTFGLLQCQLVAAAICAIGSVPVETAGGVGIANLHWREANFGSEMMTGFLNVDGNLISRMTVGAMNDLGFTVNPNAADDFSVALLQSLTPKRSTLSENWERVVNASPNLISRPRR
jgi:hypothetical protein